jgi:cytochrome c oxidase cbb3-type subunit I/II
VFSDIFLVNSLYTGTHIYVGVAFIYIAIVHFLMTRPLQAVLFNKTLSSITFWGFLFLLPWTNFKYYYGSVLPNWIENISIYLSMSLAVPLLAFLLNYIKTIQSKEVDEIRSLDLLNFSVILFSVTTIFHIISSFENLLPILGITNFVNVITYGLVGSLVLATISLSYYLIPKLYGREVAYSRLEGITFFGFKFSYLLLLINNTVLGVNSGYSWNAGANAGSPTIYGEGYEIVWSLIGINFSLNTFISLLLLGSGFLYLISVLRAISSGSITTVEEMVYSND